MVIACPVWTAHTYNSHPRSPWKALSNWAVQQALERGCKSRTAWTTLRKVSLLVLSLLLKSLTADRNQYICYGSCPHSRSTAKLVVDCFTPNVPFRICKWSVDSGLENNIKCIYSDQREKGLPLQPKFMQIGGSKYPQSLLLPEN
jgi:hypothetical protein